MSKAEILAEIPKLQLADREEIRRKLGRTQIGRFARARDRRNAARQSARAIEHLRGGLGPPRNGPLR